VGVVVEPQGLEGADFIGVVERAENGGCAEVTADNAIAYWIQSLLCKWL
jgi:hypothetical protein